MNIDEPTQRTVQHFELWGHRDIWKEGWKVVTLHQPGDDYQTEEWELYHVDEDFTEIHNVAHLYPEKLTELKGEWEKLASKYDVFPLDDFSVFKNRSDKQTLSKSLKSNFTFIPTCNFRINTFDSKISIKDKPLIVTTEVELLSVADEGVLFAQGGRFGGFTFYMKNNRLVFHYSYFGEKHYTIRSTSTIPIGVSHLKFKFIPKDSLQSISRSHCINDKQVGEGNIDRIVPGLDAPGYFTIGENIYSPVSPEYESPFRFSEKLKYVRFEQPEGGLDPESRFKAELATE